MEKQLIQKTLGLEKGHLVKTGAARTVIYAIVNLERDHNYFISVCF